MRNYPQLQKGILMCQKIWYDAEDTVVIPSKGIGWKYFWEHDGKYYPLVMTSHGYTKKQSDDIKGSSVAVGETIQFLDTAGFDNDSDGFCFFLSEEKALRRKKLISEVFGGDPEQGHVTLKRILYEEGMVERPESRFISGETFTVALCRIFTILED